MIHAGEDLLCAYCGAHIWQGGMMGVDRDERPVCVDCCPDHDYTEVEALTRMWRARVAQEQWRCDT